MKQNIKYAPLSNFIDINPENISKKYPYNEIEYIDISSVASGYLNEKPIILNLANAPSRAKRIVRENDSILATVRPNLRAFLYITNPKPNTIVSTGFAVLRAKNKVDPRFIYYAVTNPIFTGYLTNNAKGTSYPAVDTNIILRGEIPDFSYITQQKIADILSKYDDLIENNRRRIELLEESARSLYREWFVYLRFPGHEHIPIIDGIPEGWKKKKLEDIAYITMGQSPESEYYNDSGLGLYFHQGVSNFGSRFPENKIFCTKVSRIAEAGDILFSVRAPVGRINISLERIIIGRGLAAICSRSNYQNLLFYQLKNYFFKEDMIGSGSIFASVTKKDLQNVELITPLNSLIELFVNQIKIIDDQIKILHLQNQKLQEARDLLLPRLMNGEIAL